MDSRCTISMKNDDGSIISTYCYTDGDLGNVGLTLYEHYQNCDKIETLLGMGHIQHLDALIDAPPGVRHSIEAPLKGVCTFLRRDSAQKITQFQSQKFDSLYEYKKNLMFEDNNYFFNHMEELWYVFNAESDKFVELGKALMNSPDLELSDKSLEFITKQQEAFQQLKNVGLKKDFNDFMDKQVQVFNRKMKG